jgi:23S rRNA (pseudouridine1915-N3)-methyltransferase
MSASVKNLVLIVGGPYGFSQAVYRRANGQISFSALTFSHQMIRLLLLEQTYRAFTIIKGEAYHHN